MIAETMGSKPSVIYLQSHTGLNRHGRREWEHESRGVAFTTRIATTTNKQQKLLASRRTNRWAMAKKVT